mgnify:CR=1 FL=1
MKNFSKIFTIGNFYFSALVFASDWSLCSQDISQKCQGVQPGGGRIFGCLVQKKNLETLSPECKTLMTQTIYTLSTSITQCKSEIKSHCKGVKAGEGRIYKCLKENEEKYNSDEKKFSPACKQALVSLTS